MSAKQSVLTTKKKGHPVGRLGQHIKSGMIASFAAYCQDQVKEEVGMKSKTA